MFIEKTCAEEFLAYIDKNVNIFFITKKNPKHLKLKKEEVLRTNVHELQNWFLWLSPQLSLIFSLLEIISP